MDAYTLAKAYFDVKEYDRAAHFLHGCNSKKAYFLFMYSRYLVRAILRCYFFFNEACVFRTKWKKINLLNSLAVGHQMNVLY
jgi:hypothetical protein